MCLSVGMIVPENQLHLEKYTKMARLIADLIRLYNHRKHIFLTTVVNGDPTMEEAVLGKLTFSERNPNLTMDFYDWTFNATATAIHFFKQFQFVNDLKFQDQINILKSIYVHANLLSCAFSAYQSNRHFMSYPDGCDVLPYTSHHISEGLEHNIRCRLPGKLSELRISEEELVLLTVVLACNPGTHCTSSQANL